MADNFNTRLYARGYASNVSMRAPTTTKAPAPKCVPDCADCGLLECLCRPRFFAGQLLSEQDLNRLDSYIRAKNRMHNLQLHGWGVVNGLQVRCDTCGTGVIVGTGYAIDPCGEDIIVCGDTPVDICALIKRCQPADITCMPSSRTNGASDCDDIEEDWVLAIRYSETQARSVTALRSTPACACGATSGSCGCSGSCGSGGSCGCRSKKKKGSSTAPTNAITTATTRTPKSTPSECEATAICEGYEFDVFPAPNEPKRKDPRQLTGALIDNIRCCLEPLMDSLPKAPGPYNDYSDNTGSAAPTPDPRDNANAAAWNVWCCRMKNALIGFFSNGPQANCTLIETLQSLPCPSPNDPNFDKAMQAAVDALKIALLEAIFACLCNALLPPAPCGTSDDRVPLAIVTVRKKDCKVLRVCNWTHLRKPVITMPAIEYWLSWIPFFSSIQDAIAAFCCADLGRFYEGTRMTGMRMNTGAGFADGAYAKVNPSVDKQHTKDNQTMTALVMSAFARRNATLDPAALVNGVFGLELETQEAMTETEKANVGPFLLLNQMLRPLVASVVPGTASAKEVKADEKVKADEETTASLHVRVAALEKAIKEMGGKVP